MIYFDNAATTIKKPPHVGDAMVQALSVGNSGRGAHGPSLAAARIIYDTREKLARLFGAENPCRIAFTSNATEAINIAVNGLLTADSHVITTACEHNSVLRPLYRKEKEGMALTILPADQKGAISYEQLRHSFRKNTKAVMIQHASNLTGNVMDLSYISSLAHKNRALLIVDAAQSAGCLPIDTEEQGIDILCFTGHKAMMGPQGTGGIYVKQGIEIESFCVGGSGVFSFSKNHPPDLPTALEAGTLNVHGIAGLNAAAEYLLHKGVAVIGQYERELAELFLEQIREIDRIRLFGDYSAKERTAVVSLNVGSEDSARIADLLWDEYQICVRAGAHCAPLLHQTFGTAEQGIVRFSFSWYNTKDEVLAAADALKELALSL